MTKTNLTLKHDSIKVKATFADGSILEFKVNRKRDSMTVKNVPADFDQKCMNKIMPKFEFQSGDASNVERFNRIETMMQNSTSILNLSK